MGKVGLGPDSPRSLLRQRSRLAARPILWHQGKESVITAPASSSSGPAGVATGHAERMLDCPRVKGNSGANRQITTAPKQIAPPQCPWHSDQQRSQKILNPLLSRTKGVCSCSFTKQQRERKRIQTRLPGLEARTRLATKTGEEESAPV